MTDTTDPLTDYRLLVTDNSDQCFTVPFSFGIVDWLSPGQAQSSLVKPDKAKNFYFDVQVFKPRPCNLATMNFQISLAAPSRISFS